VGELVQAPRLHFPACGVERVSIVRCVYVDASDCWYEVDEGSIALDASNCDAWFKEE
jgi:hypothetical protein